MKIVTIFTFLILVVVIFSVYYFNSNLHKHEKFKGYVKFLGAIVIVFTIFTIVLQVKSDKEKGTADSIFFFSNLTKDLLDDTFKLFIEHPEVSYYYNQLMGIEDRLPSKRYKEMESQISMIIFSRCASILYYISQNRQQQIVEGEHLKDLENRFLGILGTFFKSSIFRENWYVYNRTLCGDLLRNYIRTHFSNYVRA